MSVDGKVCIIVPAHNEESRLAICMDSLLRQSYSNIEVIVVDDHSTDHTWKICEDYAMKDARVKAIQTSKCGSVGRLSENYGAIK